MKDLGGGETVVDTVLGSVTGIVTALKGVAGLFTEPVPLAFVSLAFVSAAIGTFRKMVPMKKR